MAHLSQHQIRAGKDAEAEVKWHLDRCIQNTSHYHVFHNLVIPDPKSASPCQIDHLVVGRFLNFLVFETKSTRGGCSLNPRNGVWGRYYQGRRAPMPSPIEQNRRHIECLKSLLLSSGFLPVRFGVTLAPSFENWVLVEPGADVPRKYEEAWLVQRDMLETAIKQYVDAGRTSILKLITSNEMDELGLFLGRFVPAETKLATPPPLPNVDCSTRAVCATCGEPVDDKVVRYCQVKKSEMGGRILCRNCQAPSPSPGVCEGCGMTLTPREVDYCRLKRKGFARRYACRRCQ